MGALKALASIAEDVALGLGAVSAFAGAWLVFGIGPALMLAGALLIAYGVWISPRKVQ